ncbi:MAG: leucine-rich repeat domain-containing protein, partial [Treponema sp.]|nr:leucine-rich repeat domain-containing protein [Treponema sp.]
KIGSNAFNRSLLSGIVIPDSVTYISERAFYRVPLTSVTIGANVELGEYAFTESFLDAYFNEGMAAGTYTRSYGDSQYWTRARYRPWF